MFYYPHDEDKVAEESNQGHLIRFKRCLQIEIDEFLLNFVNSDTIASELHNISIFWRKYRLKLPII